MRRAADDTEESMFKRIIFVTGITFGYVLGARAGYERYQQICARSRDIYESETVQNAISRGTEFVHDATPVVKSAATEYGTEFSEAAIDVAGKAYWVTRNAAATASLEAYRASQQLAHATASGVSTATSFAATLVDRLGERGRLLSAVSRREARRVSESATQVAGQVQHSVQERTEVLRKRGEDVIRQSEDARANALRRAGEARETALAAFDNDDDEMSPVERLKDAPTQPAQPHPTAASTEKAAEGEENTTPTDPREDGTA